MRVCWLICCVGLGFILLLIHVFRKKRLRDRTRKSLESTRTLQYTLPDRENSYVRARLNTVLYVQDETGESGVMQPLSLGYAQELLRCVNNAELSTAERLQIQEMNAMFSMFLKKVEWTSGDVRCANELCGALLKLAAKYAV